MKTLSNSAFDLGVEEGVLVSHRGRQRTNLYVSDGRVALITDQRMAARKIVDAKNLLVMPGMIDSHVHLMDPGATDREDFPTGSAAAARAGVTTVIEHSHVSPVRNSAELHEKATYLAARSYIDFGLAAHSIPGDVETALDAWHAGAMFLKVFTCTTHGVGGHSTAQMSRLFTRLALADGICLVHCEDESLLNAAEEELLAAGRVDGAVINEWRTRTAEELAVDSVARLAHATGVAIVVAHASSPEVLDITSRYRSLGARVTVESCPQYFVLLEHEAGDLGPLRKFTPPARARSRHELATMWGRLAAKQVDLISSDHAPSTISQKLGGSIWDAHFGVPGIDTTLSLLADAAHQGLISYERLVEVYSYQPARTYRLYPRKGTLEIGADADLVLLDPDREWVVCDDEILSKARWSPYSGRTLRGRPVATYLRGLPVSVEGEILAQPGTGRYLCGPSSPV